MGRTTLMRNTRRHLCTTAAAHVTPCLTWMSMVATTLMTRKVLPASLPVSVQHELFLILQCQTALEKAQELPFGK